MLRYADDRPATAAFDYTGSIRLYVLGKFVRDHGAELRRRRVFYHDADVVFPRGLPPALARAAFPAARATRAVVLANATIYTGFDHVERTAVAYRKLDATAGRPGRSRDELRGGAFFIAERRSARS